MNFEFKTLNCAPALLVKIHVVALRARSLTVPFEQIEKPKRAGDGVWLCGYGYSKIERDKVQIQARPPDPSQTPRPRSSILVRLTS